MYYCVIRSKEQPVRKFYTNVHTVIRDKFYETFDKFEYPKMTVSVHVSEFDANNDAHRIYTLGWGNRGGVVKLKKVRK